MEARTSDRARGGDPRGICARHSLWIRARPPFQRFLGLAHYSIKSELSRLYGDRMGHLWRHHRRGCYLHGSIDEAIRGTLPRSVANISLRLCPRKQTSLSAGNEVATAYWGALSQLALLCLMPTTPPFGWVRPQNVAQSAIRRRRFSNRSPRR
jgi:hypothetical protein